MVCESTRLLIIIIIIVSRFILAVPSFFFKFSQPFISMQGHACIIGMMTTGHRLAAPLRLLTGTVSATPDLPAGTSEKYARRVSPREMDIPVPGNPSPKPPTA